MWPTIGLKMAVIVVGGWDNGEECGGISSESTDNCAEGGVASGSVVKRSPADTVCGSSSVSGDSQRDRIVTYHRHFSLWH